MTTHPYTFPQFLLMRSIMVIFLDPFLRRQSLTIVGKKLALYPSPHTTY